MTQYVIVYLGGDQPSSKEVGNQHMANMGIQYLIKIRQGVSIQ